MVEYITVRKGYWKMNKNNIRFTSAVLSLAVATGIALTSPSECFAEKKPKQGKFIEAVETEEGLHYNRYVVKEGDNVSRISQKICRYFGQEASTEYWPVIAFLNNFPRTLKPGDIVIFPETYEDMAIMNANLKAVGWTARYIQVNDIYGKRKAIRRTSLNSLLHEIYGDDVCIDEDFIHKYLKTVGLDGKYDLNSSNFTPDQLFELTDWIPTLSELGVEPQVKVRK